MDERIEVAVRKSVAAFWENLKHHFPECEDDVVPERVAFNLTYAAKLAVAGWIESSGLEER